jgi:hypothetical protein
MWGCDDVGIMRNDKENLIVRLTLEFALDIVAFTELLEENKKYVTQVSGFNIRL